LFHNKYRKDEEGTNEGKERKSNVVTDYRSIPLQWREGF
jgi:hypothetical protein